MKDERERVKAHVHLSEAKTKAFALELEKFVERSIRRFAEEKKLGTLDKTSAARVLATLFEEMQRLGLRDKLSSIRELYADELSFIENRFRRLDARMSEREIFTDIDRSTIDAIVNVEEQKLLAQTGAKVAELQSTMMRSVIVGEPLVLDKLFEAHLDTLGGNVYTLTNTGLAGFERTVTLTKAKDLGFELMLYIGPDDQITRPFCEKLLKRKPPVYTMREIDSMKNGQGLPVSQYGGGYNCRHQWGPLTEERAREMGWTSK